MTGWHRGAAAASTDQNGVSSKTPPAKLVRNESTGAMFSDNPHTWQGDSQPDRQVAVGRRRRVKACAEAKPHPPPAAAPFARLQPRLNSSPVGVPVLVPRRSVSTRVAGACSRRDCTAAADAAVRSPDAGRVGSPRRRGRRAGSGSNDCCRRRGCCRGRQSSGRAGWRRPPGIASTWPTSRARSSWSRLRRS